MKKVPYAIYMAKGVELYGADKTKWKFECIQCHHVQTQQDFTDAGIADADTLAHFSCIGRFVKGVGCD